MNAMGASAHQEGFAVMHSFPPELLTILLSLSFTAGLRSELD